jgi:hypothetical protein
MIVAYGAILGLLIGWALGGHIGRLRDVRLRLAWAVLPVVPVQLLLVWDPWRAVQDPAVYGPLILLSYVPLVVFTAANVRLPGMGLIAVGLGANLLVMLANGGLMPVSPESIQAAAREEETVVGARTPSAKGIVLPASETRLAFLSDTIVTPTLPRPLPSRKIISIGDILTFLGLAFGVQALMRRRPSNQQPTHDREEVATVPRAHEPQISSGMSGGIPSSR